VQREWKQNKKEEITREYFPVVADRLKMKINITPKFTTMVTGHSNVNLGGNTYKLKLDQTKARRRFMTKHTR
jgi:hypothetical protein